MTTTSLNSDPAGTRINHFADDQRSIRALQLGLGWFPDQPGGLDRYYFHLLQSLAEARVETRGLVVGVGAVARELSANVQSIAAATESLPRRWIAMRKSVEAQLAEFKPDIVVSHFALYAAPVLAKTQILPHVVHFHGPWAMECRAEGAGALGCLLKRKLERRVYRSADLCVVLSEAFGRILVEHYGVDQQRIRVIPGGVDTDRFRPTVGRREARESLGWPADRKIVLAVRRLVNRMGLDRLIAAVDRVRKDHPDVLLLIAGKGPLAEPLRQLVAKLKLDDHVRLLGFVPDDLLPRAMRAADLTVIPSTALEGFGLTAVESLAAGTPPMVAPIGGLPEVVRDLDPSLIFRDITSEAIAEGITGAVSTRIQLPGEHQCVEYARRFDWSVIARRVSDVYREALRLHS